MPRKSNKQTKMEIVEPIEHPLGFPNGIPADALKGIKIIEESIEAVPVVQLPQRLKHLAPEAPKLKGRGRPKKNRTPPNSETETATETETECTTATETETETECTTATETETETATETESEYKPSETEETESSGTDTKENKRRRKSQKDYYETFKKKFPDVLKRKYECEICGGKFSYFNKSSHNQTKKHIQKIKGEVCQVIPVGAVITSIYKVSIFNERDRNFLLNFLKKHKDIECEVIPLHNLNGLHLETPRLPRVEPVAAIVETPLVEDVQPLMCH